MCSDTKDPELKKYGRGKRVNNSESQSSNNYGDRSIRCKDWSKTESQYRRLVGRKGRTDGNGPKSVSGGERNCDDSPGLCRG